MATIFTLENNNDFSEKVNIDDLYEKRKEEQLNQMELFNKILGRIHVRIKNTSRQKNNNDYCWYLVPEVIIGIPRYDHASCIAYLIDKLKTNGFQVRYTHPNMLLIYWGHYVPTYVRDEIKKKTGIKINEHGLKLRDDVNDSNVRTETLETISLDIGKNSNSVNITKEKEEKRYTPINNYKPSGSLIYNNDTLNKVEKRLQRL